MASASETSESTAEARDSAFRAALDLRVVMSRLRRRFLSVTEDGSLAGGHAALLRRIVRSGITTASALATAEQVTPQSITVTLGALQRRGYVVRTQDPADGRRQLIEATPEGRARVEEARAARHEWLETALVERYTQDERQTIMTAMALLERLLDR